MVQPSTDGAAPRINGDFRRRVVLDTGGMDWMPSPQAGVERRMLDRIGGEVARATSLVRYAPASRFPEHMHALGEEFLVLDGVFSDETGDFPAGSYVRNPPGSRHAPFTRDGCTIFVKLRQMHEDDQARVVVDAYAPAEPAGMPGHSATPLHADSAGGERVTLERLAPGARVAPYLCDGGEEILVLAGTLADEAGQYRPGTWIRNPDGHRHGLESADGCTFWVKRGHLRGV